MTRISYVNGQYVEHDKAMVHIEDRAHVFADGVYEVMYVSRGVILNADDHIARLIHSLAGLDIVYPVSLNQISHLVMELVARNHCLQDAMIYLQISRGVAPRNHAFPIPPVAPSVIMTLSPLPKPKDQEYEQGVTAITHPDLRWKRRDLKTVSLLANILAKQEAAKQGAVEAILIEDNDVVTEASASNVFIVDQKGVVLTHPKNNLILAGVTRKNLLKLLAKHDIVYREETFTQAQLKQAKEVWITSTTKHILPVVTIDGKSVGTGQVGEVAKRLRTLYAAFVEEQISDRR